MGRILAIDYGNKRTGLAVTDMQQIIANGLTTVPTHQLTGFLAGYLAKENVDVIVVGQAFNMQGSPSEASKYIEPFVKTLRKQFPNMPVHRMDERFTSVMAHQTMRDAGLSKKGRQNKDLVDTISATILLQSYLEQKTYIENRP